MWKSEPYQLGSNEGSNKDPRNNPREMEYNNNKSNKHHFDVSDFMHTRPLSMNNDESNANPSNQEEGELIIQKLEASKEQSKPIATQEQKHTDH